MRDDNIVIRLANINDLKNIIEFIDKHWRNNHILTNYEFMKYEHVINNELRFVIAEDKQNKKIYGICGYIQSNESVNSDIWTVIWKTIKNSNIMLGIDILNFLRKETKCRIISSCGINPKTKSIYKFLEYSTGKLEHYYRLLDKEEYKIAIVRNKIIKPVYKSNYKLIKIKSFEELKEKFDIEQYKNRKPFKDEIYIKYRYFNHPVYEYKIFGIMNYDRKINSILIAREIMFNDSKILRLVDFIGDDNDLAKISYELQNIMEINSYEYVDFYCHGISKSIMEKTGMILRDDKDENIIPNYFEPYEQRNIDINYFTSDDDNFYMFKADGDQDRPSIL